MSKAESRVNLDRDNFMVYFTIKLIFNLYKMKVDYTIIWEILDRAQSYSNATKRCKSCT